MPSRSVWIGSLKPDGHINPIQLNYAIGVSFGKEIVMDKQEKDFWVAVLFWLFLCGAGGGLIYLIIQYKDWIFPW